MAFLACVHLALFLALSLSPDNSLVSSWCDHSMLASLLGSTGSGHFPRRQPCGLFYTEVRQCSPTATRTLTAALKRVTKQLLDTYSITQSYFAIDMPSCDLQRRQDKFILRYISTVNGFANFVTSFSTMDLCVSWTGQLYFELSAKICIRVV